MADKKSPWSLSWFRAQGFDCDIDNSFMELDNTLLNKGTSSQEVPLFTQNSQLQTDLRLESLVPSNYDTTDSDESQLELISQTLHKLTESTCSINLADPSKSHIQKTTNSVSASIKEASRIINSIDHSLLLASSLPSIEYSNPNLLTHIPEEPIVKHLEIGKSEPTLPGKRVNLIVGELMFLQHEITTSEAELQRLQKTIATIPYTRQRRRMYLMEQCAELSAKLNSLQQQWNLIVKEQTAQLNELRHSIVYYKIRAEAKIKPPYGNLKIGQREERPKLTQMDDETVSELNVSE